MSKFTAALLIKEYPELHVTLCFCEARKGGKITTSRGIGVGCITDIQYWQDVDITVAIINSDFIIKRNEYYIANNYTYEDLEFTPHATLSKGDTTKDNKNLIGKAITLTDEYIRIF